MQYFQVDSIYRRLAQDVAIALEKCDESSDNTSMHSLSRKCRMNRVLGSTWLLCSTLLATVSVAAEDSGGDIARWVNQLSADRFADRELATLKLIEAGVPAIESVQAAIGSGDPEASQRGLQVLRQLALSDTEATEEAARAALENIARDKTSRAHARARQTLDGLNELRQDRAIAAIRRLGGSVDEAAFNQVVFGGWEVVTSFRVTIDDNWKGGKSGLRYLRWLPDLREVTFRGKEVQDDWVASIAGLEKLTSVELNRTSVSDAAMATAKSLPMLDRFAVKYTPVTDAAIDDLQAIRAASVIMLYGTKISPAGAEKLKTAAADTAVRIDYRRGAFLGVGCQQTDDGCAIFQVHPGSCAEKAGIQEGDLVLQYNGKPVASFEDLTALIAENVAGDKVTMKLRRFDEELTKELTLGEWE
jgi:hypothetical protein